MFLHTGWLHLIGNMWFLWLAGFILEDRWGRVIYPIFYLLAGIAASLFHVLFYHGSLAPVLGASGAIAALMGGFLVRFPKLKIEMMWFMLIFRVRFKAYAYWLLPMWLFMEIFYGSLLTVNRRRSLGPRRRIHLWRSCGSRNPAHRVGASSQRSHRR